MKKIVSVIVTVCFLLSVCTVGALAEDKPVFSISGGEAAVGDEVSVIFSVSGNTGLASFRFSITFDTASLEPITIEPLDTFENGLFSANILEPNVDLSTYDNITFIWASADECTDNGDIYEIKFKVKNTAKPEVTLGLAYAPEEIIDSMIETVEIDTVDGKLTISGTTGDSGSGDSGSGSGGSDSGSGDSGSSSGGSGSGSSSGEDTTGGEETTGEDATVGDDTTGSEETTGSDETTDGETSGETIHPFNDIQAHWAKDYITDMAVKGVFKGYEDGSFRPDIGLTRQEMAVSIVRLLGLESELGKVNVDTFTDDASIAPWASDYVYLLVSKGIFAGHADGSFEPEAIITREQLTLVLTRALEAAPDILSELTFADAGDISDWAADAVRTMLTLKVVNGYEDNTFRPANAVSRAEACTMMYKFLQFI